MDDLEFQKMMDEIDEVDFDDLGEDDFRGEILNEIKWGTYQQIANALLKLMDIQDPDFHAEKVIYDKEPYEKENFASAMVTFAQISKIDTDAKEILSFAFHKSDWCAMTTAGNKIRISFVVRDIWVE